MKQIYRAQEETGWRQFVNVPTATAPRVFTDLPGVYTDVLQLLGSYKNSHQKRLELLLCLDSPQIRTLPHAMKIMD